MTVTCVENARSNAMKVTAVAVELCKSEIQVRKLARERRGANEVSKSNKPTEGMSSQPAGPRGGDLGCFCLSWVGDFKVVCKLCIFGMVSLEANLAAKGR
jgi:hypothetical protein